MEANENTLKVEEIKKWM